MFFCLDLLFLIRFSVMTTNSLICVTCVHHTLILCYIVVFHVFSSFDHQIKFLILNSEIFSMIFVLVCFIIIIMFYYCVIK